jgi:Zn-dependent protease with chaperone function
MTDFFARQEKARSRTGVFIVYFGLAVLATMLLVYLVVALIFAAGQKGKATTLWHPQMFLWTTGATVAVIGGGCLVRIAELSSGGGGVARALGGRQLDPQTRNPRERQLLNVVEEISLASGVPVPEVYLLDQEQGINAFAAGTSPSNAAIGVTRGCLQSLTRDELQGVIAHEFSHILNGDMRLNMRLIGLIAGILTLTTIGYILMQVRSGSREKGAGQIVLLGLGLLVIGWVGALFARMIQAAISRQREFLADASAVQFTRLPQGLAGALKKIGGREAGSKMDSPHASESNHLFFSDGMSSSWSSLMATHPPLVERIRALDPSFDGRFPEVESAEAPIVAVRRQVPPPPPPRAAGAGPLRPPVIGQALPSVQVLGLAGLPTSAHIQQAADWCANLPEGISVAAREPFGATLLVFSLLLSRDPAERGRQLQLLATTASAPVATEAGRMVVLVDALPMEGRLPLVDLLLPALRGMSPPQYGVFTRAVQALIASDQRVDLFEFALQKVLLRHLAPTFEPQARRPFQYYSFKAVREDIGLLLSSLAHVGAQNVQAAQEAHAAGVAALGVTGVDFPFVSWEGCHPQALDGALDRCNETLPAIRGVILQGMVQTVAHDGVVQPAEAELLRAFADAMGCPVPPFLQGKR